MTRNKLWIPVFACFLLVQTLASAAEAPLKAPQAFLPESSFSFQPVLEGTEVVHEFVIQNRGEAPLNILQIKSG